MKCDACDLRDAIIHVRQVQRSGVQELHLCEECARERGYLREEDAEMPIAGLLSGLLTGPPAAEAETEHAACRRCGLAAAEFRKRGRAGCAECYATFDRDLRAMLSHIAGRPRHAGKLPVGLGEDLADDRERLRDALREAVEREDYELAAQLRDRIREIDGDR